MWRQFVPMLVILTPALGCIGLFLFVVIRWRLQTRRRASQGALAVLPGGRHDDAPTVRTVE